jgi:hypothetical protein
MGASADYYLSGGRTARPASIGTAGRRGGLVSPRRGPAGRFHEVVFGVAA